MIRPAILTLALCLAATPAAAHWDRTRWGMTPEAVTALYPAATHSGDPAIRDPAQPVLELGAPYVLDGESFSEVRLFFRDRGRLSMVELTADRTADQIPGLQAWLERRYGKPVAARGALAVPADGRGSYRAEYAGADGDRVVLVVMLWPDGETLAAVSWSPPTP